MKKKLLVLFCVLTLACLLTTPGWGADKGTVFYLAPNQFDEFQPPPPNYSPNTSPRPGTSARSWWPATRTFHCS